MHKDSDNWTFQSDFSNFSPVLNQLWQDFAVIRLNFGRPFSKKLDGQDNFQISFSVRIDEVHILLCERDFDLRIYDRCYYLTLGGYKGKHTLARKCQIGEINTKLNNDPTGNCRHSVVSVNNNSVINSEEWHHFSLSKVENTYIVRKYGLQQSVLSYTDNSDAPFLPRYVLLRAYDKPGFAKIHQVNAFAFGKSAQANITVQMTLKKGIAIFVKACENCIIQILVRDANDNTLVYSTQITQSAGWQQINLHTEEVENVRITASVSNSSLIDGEEKWYISDTIKSLQDDDIISLRVRSEGCCYALTHPQYKICTEKLSEYNPGDWKCAGNSLGRNCISCRSIFHTAVCPPYPICDVMLDGEILCSCPAGTYGSYCKRNCSDGFFGHDCRRECKQCMDSCEPVSGMCISARCDINFKGERCDTPILPVIKHGLIIDRIGYNYVNLLINMEFEGERRPLYYKLQFKRQNETRWSTFRTALYGFFSTSTRLERVSKLKPNVKYQVRIVFVVAKNDSYEGSRIPFTSFRTTCADVNLRDVSVILTSTTFFMAVNVHDLLCPLDFYKFSLRNGTFNETAVLMRRNYVERLTPNSGYTLTILKSEQAIIEENYKTDIEAVNQMKNLQITKISDRDVSLKWQVFRPSDGVELEYKLVRYLNCEDRSELGPWYRLETNETQFTIKNLHPYAEYVVEMVSPPTQIRFNTTSSNITEEEIPVIRSSQLRGSLTVKLAWDCKMQNGPTEYDLLLFCESDWCHNRTQPSSNSSFYKLKNELNFSFEVLNYTDYRIELKIFRPGFPTLSTYTPFKSSPAAPGKVLDLTVHSVNRSSVGLRWRPPSDIIDDYRLTGKSDSSRLNHTFITTCDPNNYCKPWTSYICCICGNLRHNVTYTFTISAINYRLPLRSDSEKVTAKTIDSIPGQPLNVTLSWDEEYNLTVKWLHPFQPNGPLTTFLIFLNNEQLEPYYIDEERPDYEYHIDARNLTAQEIIVKIGVQNAFLTNYADDEYTMAPPRKPNFVAAPILEEATSSSVKVLVPDVVNQEGVCEMFAILTDLDPSAGIGDRHHEEYFDDIGVGQSSWFIAGANSSYAFPKEISYVNEHLERPVYVMGSEIPEGLLQKGHSYRITLVLRNTFEEFSRQRTYGLSFTLDSLELYLLALVLIPAALIVAFIIIVIRRFCLIKISESNALLDRNRQSADEHDAHIYEPAPEVFVNPSENDSSGPSLRRNNKSKLTDKLPTFKMLSFNRLQYTNPVYVKDLDRYVKEAMSNGDLANQFKEILNCPVQPNQHGNAPENRSKNINPDLAAYDHSRVKLENIYEDPYADYINANYINGYGGQGTYIATQGPKDNTINDLWRMVWQEKVEHIVVVSGVIEGAQRKFEKYWPEINGFEYFAEIKVAYVMVDVFANYEIRHFDLVRDGDTRRVKQICFTCSPDVGASQYVRSFASFSKKILSLELGETPIIVHGRGGFGRTGILILCDICLRMALAEGKVDIYHHLHKLREQRINMVENVQQYKIAHFVLLLILQCVSAPFKTGIFCTKTMNGMVEEVIATEMEKQMKFLDDSAWQDEAMRNLNLGIDCPTVNPKRRLKLKLDDLSHASFYPYYCLENDSQVYIRAEVVDSFLTPSRFITTKNPTGSTLSVFWRLIIEKQIKMIICLHKLNPLDTAACMFYPTSGAFSFNPLPNASVKFVSKYNNGYCDIYNVTLTSDDKKLQTQSVTTITIVQLNEWHQSVLRPDRPNGLIAAYESMNDLGKLCATVLVTCHDGIRACGVYVALCYLLEKIKSDHICDVCLAVRTVRQSRREFVRPLEQFKFLYECGLEYVRQFETYANFKSPTDARELGLL